MTAAALPRDIPQFVDPRHGSIVPAEAEPDGEILTVQDAWDPWTHANVPLMLDHSMPTAGADNYGEPSGPGSPQLNQEWGVATYPLLDYQDENPAVAYSPRKAPNINGPAGQYTGAQINAAEAISEQPVTDYWSVLIGAS